jgi:hypothetical protein
VPILRFVRRSRPERPAGAPSAASALTLLLAATLASCSSEANRRAAPAPALRASAPAAPAQRRDATVLAVFGEVAGDSLLKGQEIHVTAKDTTLILSGSVADAAAHERLLEIAGAHVGRFALVDSVRVGPADRPGAGAPAER